MKMIALFMVVAAGCIASTEFRTGLVADRARFELGCSSVNVSPLGGDAYGANGCGKRSVYLVKCTGGAARQDLCSAILSDK
jgi:hypothetical protein